MSADKQVTSTQELESSLVSFHHLNNRRKQFTIISLSVSHSTVLKRFQIYQSYYILYLIKRNLVKDGRS